METLIKKATQKSNVMYYAIFAAAVVFAFIGYFINTKYIILIPDTIQTVFASIAYIYMCVSIPFALWFFNKKVSKINELKEIEIRYSFYIKLVKLRLLLVSITFLANIILFYICHSNSFLYASGIGAVAMLFCKPKKDVIERELNPISLEE